MLIAKRRCFYVSSAPQIPPPIRKYIPAAINSFFAFSGLFSYLIKPKKSIIIAGEWQTKYIIINNSICQKIKFIVF